MVTFSFVWLRTAVGLPQLVGYARLLGFQRDSNVSIAGLLAFGLFVRAEESPLVLRALLESSGVGISILALTLHIQNSRVQLGDLRF